MAFFIVRVELPNYDDYDSFHSQMESHGFKRNILCSAQIEYELPQGTYSISSVAPLSEVVKKVEAAAHQVGVSNPQIIAVESNNYLISGLQKKIMPAWAKDFLDRLGKKAGS